MKGKYRQTRTPEQKREQLLTMALRKPLSKALRVGTAIPPAAPHSSLKTSSSSPSSYRYLLATICRETRSGVL
jgi:hypothetical protein